MEKETLKNKALEIIELIKIHFINEQGILIKGRNDSTGEVYKEIIIDDLGDFLPFLAYFKEEEVCQKHLKYIEQNINQLEFNKAFSYTDFLFGLIWYSRVGQAKHNAQELALKIADQIINKFFKKNFVGSYIKYNKLVPFLSTVDSTLIENLLEIYRIKKDKRYLSRANDLLKIFVTNKFFKEKNILPEVINFSPFLSLLKIFYSKKFSQVKIMKNNTNFGYSLLDFWRITHDGRAKEAFENLYKGIKKYAVIEGGVCNYPLGQKKIPDLVSSFAVTDMMADGWFIFREKKYLDLAKLIADYWLNLQSKKTGLFPEDSKSKLSYLDSETDMTIALFKLWELTREDKYYSSAIKTLNGIFQYHKKEKGYILQVNIDSGQPDDEIYKTKFITLLLKPIIYLLSRKEMYKDNLIFTLMKDR